MKHELDNPARSRGSLWVIAPLALASIAGGISGSSCARREGHRAQVRQGDCIACHETEYLEVQEPVHVDVYPTTCADCHITNTWTGALSHPESRFPIATGDHAEFACADCHVETNGPTGGGLNTDCGGCHTGAHNEEAAARRHRFVPDYEWQGDTNPRFCVSCHPTGEQVGHPEDRFPIETGDHAGYACSDCHDRSLGPDTDGLNTDCGGCHLGAHNEEAAAGRHEDVLSYEWDGDENPSFCLSCHPTGEYDAPGLHPEERFPISTGDHLGFGCGDCHKSSLGPYDNGVNVDCGGCHTGDHSRETAEMRHRNVATYRWDGENNPHFCTQCHPTGVF